MNLYGSGRDPAMMQHIVNLELAAHNVKARAVIAQDAPQCWTYVVRTAFGGRIEQVERLQASIAEKTAVSSCRIDRTEHGLVIQLAKPAPADQQSPAPRVAHPARRDPPGPSRLAGPA